MIRVSYSICIIIVMFSCLTGCKSICKKDVSTLFERKVEYFQGDSIIFQDSKFIAKNMGVYDWYVYNPNGSVRRIDVFLDNCIEKIDIQKRDRITYEFSENGDLIFSERFNDGELVERIVFNKSLFSEIIVIDAVSQDTTFLKNYQLSPVNE